MKEEITDQQYDQLILDTAECGLIEMAYDLMFSDPAIRAELERDDLTASEMMERIIERNENTGD